MKLQKRPFYFEETVVLPLKWHLYFNDVMKANDVHGTAPGVPLPFCFLKTPPFTSHFCTHLRVSSLVSFIAAVRNSGSFFQKGLKQSVRDTRSQRNLLTTCTCFKDCVTNLKVLSTKNSLNHK